MFSYTDRIFFFKGDTPFQEIIYQTMDFDSKNTKKNIMSMYIHCTKLIQNEYQTT